VFHLRGIRVLVYHLSINAESLGVSVKVKIPVHFGHYTNGIFEVGVPGGTVGEVLHNIAKKFPRLKGVLFPNNQLDEFLYISLNEQILTPQDDPLAKPVRDGDEVSIIVPLAGG
jgi:molybdopterin converting factor small subunit